MRPLAPYLLLASLSVPVAAQRAFDPEDWFDARLRGVTLQEVELLTDLGFDVQSRHGDQILVYVDEERALELEAMGFEVTRLPRVGPPGGPEGTGPEAANWPSFAELSESLAAVAAAHPNIVRLHDVGSSVQGRTLWFLKISDNVDVEEDEPEFKYVSSMHGDEVVGMELCRRLIDRLVNDYGTDPRITRLVDEVEIWIMPLMNPDGYVAGSRYNAQGRDLNRDFPDRVRDPSNTVTGRAPETQALMSWGFTHAPVLSANLHGGALVVNYPYDSDPDPFATYSAAPDDALFIEQSLVYSTAMPRMFASPSFFQGITNGVAWYTAYGGMQDWNYEWQGCNDVTIELDNTKWPSWSRIPGLWEEHQEPMLAYMEQCLTGVRGRVTHVGSGAPLAASVEAVGIDHAVFTDPDVGDYHRMLLPGTWTLRVAAAGYETCTVGGVPVGTGDATRVDVPLTPVGFAAPLPTIQVDGQSGAVSVSSSQSIHMTVSMDPRDLAGVPQDWWLFGTNGSATFWWTPGKIETSETPCYGGKLVPLNGTTVSRGKVPPGTWTFVFGVDVKDGAYQGSFVDAITVTSS